jgi:hypothetical protein
MIDAARREETAMKQLSHRAALTAGTNPLAQPSHHKETSAMSHLRNTVVKIVLCCALLGALVPAYAAVTGSGYLHTDEADTYSVKLVAGTTYMFIAAAGNDYADLDLGVFDADGTMKAVDAGPEASAIAFFTPSYSGTYRVVINCDDGPTSYRLSVTP